MSNLTIQINSLEALERLIGGDSQAEIDIRNSVVQKFTEKHLKAIAHQPNIAAIAESIGDAAKKGVEEVLTERIGAVKRNWNGTIESIKLNGSVITDIDNKVKSVASTLVDDAVNSTLAKLREGLEARIAGAVKLRLDYEIGNEVKKQVGEAFRRALEGTPATPHPCTK